MRPITILLAAALAACHAAPPAAAPAASQPGSLGAFSVSLAVKDIAASRAFYERLGFVVAGGDQAQKWLILRNGDTVLGLFQGMFDKNLLTFNPGWSQQAKPLAAFTDVRDLQAAFEGRGLTLASRAVPGDGPANLTLLDPDGNVILVDQHVQRR